MKMVNIANLKVVNSFWAHLLRVFSASDHIFLLVITRRLIFSEDNMVLVSGRHLSSILLEFQEIPFTGEQKIVPVPVLQ